MYRIISFFKKHTKIMTHNRNSLLFNKTIQKGRLDQVHVCAYVTKNFTQKNTWDTEGMVHQIIIVVIEKNLRWLLKLLYLDHQKKKTLY